MSGDDWITVRRAAFILFLAIVAVYLPDAGHGFVKDDFDWIARSHVGSIRDLVGLLHTPANFFRPVVALSFAVDRAIGGLNAGVYGLTNLVLAVCCGVGVYTLALALELSEAAALAAAAIWIFNWSGIRMAVLWISGRTELLMVLFATCASVSLLRRRWVLAGSLMLLAMLSKEEAVLVPAVLVAWLFLVDGRSWPNRMWLRASWLGGIVWALSLGLRIRSGALTPATAPPYYQLSATFNRLLANGPQYLDRSATFAAVILILFWLLGRPRGLREVAVPRSIVLFGCLWWLGGYAITMFLPVRSSLYACLPAVGTALIAAALLSSAWHSVSPARRRHVVYAGLALPFLLWPVYHARNQRQAREAELSTRVLAALQQAGGSKAASMTIVLDDDRSRRPSLDDAFGGALQEAVDLTIGPRFRVWMSPPPAGSAQTSPPGSARRQA